jgi:hypothetical protein
VHPVAANVQFSTQYCSALTEKTFSTQKPPHRRIDFESGKTAKAPTFIPFDNYNPSELAKQASKQAKTVAPLVLGAPHI